MKLSRRTAVIMVVALAATAAVVAAIAFAAGAGDRAPVSALSTPAAPPPAPTSAPTPAQSSEVPSVAPIPSQFVYPVHVPSATTTTSPQYYNLAANMSERVLDSFRPPPGSTKLAAEPKGYLYGGSIPPSDPTLVRLAWWTTPRSVSEVAHYINTHKPPAVTPEQDGTGTTRTPSVLAKVWSYTVPGYPVYQAYTVPELYVTVERLGGKTVIGAASFLAPRLPIPAEYQIDEPITSVRVDRTPLKDENGASVTAGPAAPVTYRSPRDSKVISRLVKAYNSIAGDVTVPLESNGTCYPSPVTKMKVTFTGESGHVWTASWETGCSSGGFSMSYDGQTISQGIDPTAWFWVADVVLKPTKAATAP